MTPHMWHPVAGSSSGSSILSCRYHPSLLQASRRKHARLKQRCRRLGQASQPARPPARPQLRQVSLPVPKPVSFCYLLTNKLTQRNKVLLEKLKGRQLTKKFSAFYGTRRGSLPSSQDPAPGHYPQPDQSTTHPPTFFCKTNFNISSTHAQVFPVALSVRFPHQNLVSALKSTEYIVLLTVKMHPRTPLRHMGE